MPGYVRIKDRIPYHGKGPEELVGSLRRLLADPANKYAQKIVLEVGAPHIYVEKLVPEQEAGDIPQLSIHDAIRTNRMEEYEGELAEGFDVLWDMSQTIRAEGYEIGFIVIGNKTKFQKWFGRRLVNTDMTFFGVPVRVVPEVPEDVVIMCGTEDRTADVGDIKFSMKVSI